KDTEVQEVVEVVNVAKLMTEVATTVASIPIPAAEPAVVAIKYARKLQEEEESHAQAKDVQAKDAPTKGIQYIRRYHGYKKKPQSKSEAHKNMIAYLKNTEGFKMAFFKGKTYDQI
nr:hypothetical protein [Tanacetum cinerariifolium]